MAAASTGSSIEHKPRKPTRGEMKNMKMLGSTKVRWGFCFGLAASLWNGSPALAASLTVTTTDDSGPGSLRQAILTAAPDDAVNFSITGTITLTTGELLI